MASISHGFWTSGKNRTRYELIEVRDKQGAKRVPVHSMVAIAEGADPRKVFGNARWHVHHRNGCSLDNRPENLEVVCASEHGKTSRRTQTRMGYSHRELLSVVGGLCDKFDISIEKAVKLMP